MPKLFWVFAGRTCHFVGFVMRRLKYMDLQSDEWQSACLTLLFYLIKDQIHELASLSKGSGRVVVNCPWSVVCSEYSSFFHHLRPQNANIPTFEEVSVSSMSFLCNWVFKTCRCFLKGPDIGRMTTLKSLEEIWDLGHVTTRIYPAMSTLGAISHRRFAD